VLSKKYAKDYRLENEVGPSGRMVTRVVYCGAYYGFSADRDTLRRARTVILLSCLGYWVFFWLGLFLNAAAMRQLYVALPYFFGFLPAVYLTSSLWYLFQYTNRPPEHGLTREQRDKTYERLSTSSFLTLLLSGMAAVGMIFYFLFLYKNQGTSWDFVVTLSLIAMIVASFLVFSTKKSLTIQRLVSK